MDTSYLQKNYFFITRKEQQYVAFLVLHTKIFMTIQATLIICIDNKIDVPQVQVIILVFIYNLFNPFSVSCAWSLGVYFWDSTAFPPNYRKNHQSPNKLRQRKKFTRTKKRPQALKNEGAYYFTSLLQFLPSKW